MNFYGPEAQEPMTVISERISAGEVQLWLLNGWQIKSLAGFAGSLLTPTEMLKSERLGDGDARAFYQGRQVALRMLLAQYLRRNPKSVCLEMDVWGKPRLAPGSDALNFSCSSSNGWSLIAFANEPLGVDVEWQDARFNFEPVAVRFFSEDELALLDASNGAAARQAMFFRLWTRKEAWLKLKGVGLGGLQALKTSNLTAPWLEELCLVNGLVATLAMERPPLFVRRCRLEGELADLEPVKKILSQGGVQ